MKTVIINPEIYERLNCQDFVIDLQKSQLPGHLTFPFWTAKYLVPKNKELVIPDAIYACLTGQTQGTTGSQYDLRVIFEEKETTNQEHKTLNKIGFPSPNELFNKKILIVLAHNTFELSDIILSMPFLKIFSQATQAQISVCVNSAGVEFLHKQSWVWQVYPEIMPQEKLEQFDYVLEPSLEKMDVLSWIRSYLLKEFGEAVFHERFPVPMLQIAQEKQNYFLQELQRKGLCQGKNKFCIFNWETNSPKAKLTNRNLENYLSIANHYGF